MTEIDPQKMVDDWQEGMKQLIAKRVQQFALQRRPWWKRVALFPLQWFRHYCNARRYNKSRLVAAKMSLRFAWNSITPSEITL